MCPIAKADGHDDPGLSYEAVPSLAAMIEQIVIGCKNAIGEPVVAHILPDVFLRIELWAFGR